MIRDNFIRFNPESAQEELRTNRRSKPATPVDYIDIKIIPMPESVVYQDSIESNGDTALPINELKD